MTDDTAPAPVQAPHRMTGDTFQNLVSGLGVYGVDKATAGSFVFRDLDRRQAEMAYRGSWIAKKIVDIPAFDMTRAWRSWQAKKDQITAIEKEEKRLGVRQKVNLAVFWSRLYGGASIIMDDGGQNLEAPLNVRGKGGLKRLVVLPKHRITAGPIDWDVMSETFDQPSYYNLHGGQRGSVRIHPSRVVPFMGARLPDPDVGDSAESRVYGESILVALKDPILQAEGAAAALSAMLEEAKVDIIKIPGLLGAVLTKEFRDSLMERWQLAAVLKSINNVTLIDGNEEWDRKETTFTGLPDVAMAFMQIVSGAADIPMTRFLAQSPAGMNSTGDSDLQNYEASIAAKQSTDLDPRMEQIDPALLTSALGTAPEEINSRWNPLRVLTPEQQAAREKNEADAARAIVDSGLVPTAAMEQAFQNKLIEAGTYPGLEDAIDQAKKALLLPFEDPADEGNDIDPKTGQPYPDDHPNSPAFKAANENDPREIQVEGGKVAIKAKVRKPAADKMRDAAERSLYVSRRLINGAEFIAWAKDQGFGSVLTAGQLHVTVAFSRGPVDWMKIPSDWSGDDEGRLIVRPGGARLVERLGDKGAVVLLFTNDHLEWRHQTIEGQGATWDFDSYQPHVTITYDGADVDLSKVEPYQGKLVFGPEIFEEIVEDWEKQVEEA